MTDEELRQVLLAGLEYSYEHDDWVNPLEEALDGVEINEALWRIADGSPCIWEIVLHVAVWNENVVERILTGEPVRPSEGAWPPLPSLPSVPAWEEAKDRLRGSLALIRETVATTPMDKLNGPPYGLGDLLCRYVHVGYHLGQITKLRESYDVQR